MTPKPISPVSSPRVGEHHGRAARLARELEYRSATLDADGWDVTAGFMREAASLLRSQPDPSLLGRETVRDALREIIARTYSTDRRYRLDYEPVAEICDIAKRALAALQTSKEDSNG